MKALKRFLTYQLLPLCAVCILFSCHRSSGDGDEWVATVGSKKLVRSELNEIFPAGISKEDSTYMADEYISKWVKKELLIKKANENLTAEQKDVSKELEDYRNSLIIYKYKNELLKQRLDTAVSFEELEEQYKSNPDNFKLNNNIVKAVFIKIPLDLARPEMLKDMVADLSEEGRGALREYCLQYAKRFDLFIDNWVDFELVKKNIPLHIEEEVDFLKENRIIELNDSNYYYLVAIEDYKLLNDLAPMEYVEKNLRSLILNERKIKFLKEIEEFIYQEGSKNNTFKIFNEDN